jgi:hypothetical protein
MRSRSLVLGICSLDTDGEKNWRVAPRPANYLDAFGGGGGKGPTDFSFTLTTSLVYLIPYHARQRMCFPLLLNAQREEDDNLALTMESRRRLR